VFRNGRQAHDGPPVFAAKDEPGQIVKVNPLHDNDDRASALVIQARQQSVREPLVRRHPFGLRQNVNRR
jgi:hypothetical protein